MLAAALLVVASLAQAPLDAGRAAGEILERGNYQRELPVGERPARESAEGSEAGGEVEGEVEGRRTRRPREEDAAGGRARRPEMSGKPLALDLGLPPELGRALGVLMAGFAVVVVAVWIASALRGRNVRVREAREGGREERGEASFGTLPLEEAERLAREGRFGEAIRALLQLTFDALRGRDELRLEPSSTSREVLAGARLAEGQRTSLARLVEAVEHSLFARRAPGRADFEACAREYRALLAGERGGARG